MPVKSSWWAALAAMSLAAAACGVGAGAPAPRGARYASADAAMRAPAPVAQAFEASAAPAPEVFEANAAPPPAAPSPADKAAAPRVAAKPPTAPRSVADVRPGALLIYTAELSMAVFQVDASLAAVEQIGREAGGYLAARQDRSVTIRVPQERFDDAIARVEHLGDVTHRSVRAQDVTDEFVDLEARLKNARAMRDRLNELLARANVKEALDIEAQLSRVTEQIERFEGRLKLLREQISFSTITVDFAPVANQEVHDTSLLTSIPWLSDLGLPVLLGGHP